MVYDLPEHRKEEVDNASARALDQAKLALARMTSMVHSNAKGLTGEEAGTKVGHQLAGMFRKRNTPSKAPADATGGGSDAAATQQVGVDAETRELAQGRAAVSRLEEVEKFQLIKELCQNLPRAKQQELEQELSLAGEMQSIDV